MVQQSNSKNTGSDINPVVAQVLDLLGMDKSGFEETKSSIDDLLKQAKKPENIINKKMALLLIEMGENPLLDSQAWKGDKEVSLAMIRKDPANFSYLDPKFKNLKFGKETLKSMVKERSGFLTLQKFISENFSDKKVLKKLGKYLKTLEGVFISDIEKHLLDIKESSPKVYDEIFTKNLLSQKRKTLSLSPDFVKYFTDRVGNTSTYPTLEPLDRQVFDLSIFKEYLSLSDQDMTSEVSELFINLRSLIQIKKLKDSSDDIEGIEAGDDSEDEDSIEETRFDYHVPQYAYSMASDGCSLDIGQGEKLNISQVELDTMTDLALNNYIEAVKTIRTLKLGFILKHKQEFFSTICGIDYFSGEGISESKLLKILNKIGKKIGIPTEAKEKGEDGQESKKCFKTLGEAKYQFRDIRDTGNVAGIHYDPMKGDKTVVERALISEGLFDDQGNGFGDIQKWR